MSESNQKAYDVAKLGFVHVTKVDDKGRPVEATVPAQHGEFATVRLARNGADIKVMSCVHQPLGGGSPRPCEAHAKGFVCYHAKAICVWTGMVKDAQVVLCSDEAGARALAGGQDGARAACLWVKEGNEQWLAFLPGKDVEEIRKVEEVAHLTRVLQPILDALVTTKKKAKA